MHRDFILRRKASYCATKEPDREFRDMVHALHQAGIECIMEMYFPENTPSLQVVRSLWMWKLFYHVDGFHLMGDGVHQKVLEQDPILYGTKKCFLRSQAMQIRKICLQNIMQDLSRI